MKSVYILAVSLGLYLVSNGCSDNTKSVSYVNGDCDEIKRVKGAFGNEEVYEYWQHCHIGNMPWRQEIQGTVHDIKNDVINVPPQMLINGVEIKGYFCSQSKIPDSRIHECTRKGWKVILK